MSKRPTPPISPQRPTVLDPTRARPEPWFVGSGAGLMAGVLLLCAVLVVLRGVTLWWAAEELWRWWRTPSPAVQSWPPTRRVAPPPRAVPPPDRTQANAKLRGDPGAAFGPDDYPVAALRASEQGRVVALLAVDPAGTPIRCRVQVSSGSGSLDRAACGIALARVRFDPARDARGVAVGSTYPLKVRWVLPEE